MDRISATTRVLFIELCLRQKAGPSFAARKGTVKLLLSISSITKLTEFLFRLSELVLFTFLQALEEIINGRSSRKAVQASGDRAGRQAPIIELPKYAILVVLGQQPSLLIRSFGSIIQSYCGLQVRRMRHAGVLRLDTDSLL